MLITKLKDDSGFTLAEVVIGLTVFAVVAMSLLGLFGSLVNSAFIAKQKSVASTVATNQMEYLKSLPYDNLAVSGGSIYNTNPLPSTTTVTFNGMRFAVKTSINFIDDAYDGCAAYPSLTLKQLYCRNYPPPTGAPTTDTNPQDYKIIHVTVYDRSNNKLSEVDTQISARVSETSSTTGALFVNIIDDNGNPVPSANVTVLNTTINPNANVSDTTDSNGIAIFYGLPPDAGTDYVISASATGYSSLTTLSASGTLQPNYISQKILTQQSSYITLTIKPMGANSLIIESTDKDGDPIAGMKVYLKGGYKKYTATTDTSYYYDSLTPSDTRPTTDSNGLASVSNLVPGSYIFCGDDGSTSCKVGNTTYYLAASIPYTSSDSFNPVVVPTYSISTPPTVTFPYNSVNYLQKVRLIFTTSSSFPRIFTMTPSSLSLASGTVSTFAFQITGKNLNCSSNAAACNTSVIFSQNGNSYTSSCTGDASGLQLNCTANMSGANNGVATIEISNSSGTLNIPGSPMMGGLNVTP